MSTNDKRCFKCKEEVSSGQYIAVGSYFYHPNCFVCRHCSSPIKGNYVDHRETNFPYHPECMEKVDEQQAMSQGKVCQSCQKACFRGKYLTLTNGTMYHSQCFVCADCKHPITGSYLSYGTEKVPLHETCARKRDNATAITEGKICKKCGKPCVVGQIMTLSTGEMYHARCFTCIQCKKTIEGKFAQHGTNNQPFHLECLEAIQNKLTISTSSTNRLHNDSSNTTIGAQGKVEKEKARLCKKCNLACTTGQFYSTASAIYHADCFRCSDPSCNGLITGKYTDYGEPPLPYHPACGKELFSPRYTLCTSTMEGQYFRHPYFESEIYCMSHESVPSCFACSRKEPLPSSRREGFVDLMDGRSLCVQCSSSIIVDSSEAQALYLGIVDFMGRELGLPIPPEMRDVPVLLVDIQSLNESRSRLGDVLGHHNTAAEAEGEISAVSPAAKNPEETGGSAKASACPIGASVEAAQQLIQQRAESRSSKSAVRHTGSEGIIRGVTLSTCAQVKYLPSTGLQFDHSRKSMVARPQAPEIYHMKQVRDVTAVLVLYGLPRDLMASILAHEAMHVWLKLNKDFPFRMPPKLEEGLCQVISYLYLESLVAKTTDQAGEAAAPAADVTPASAHQNMVASAPGGVVRKGGAIAVASANGAAVAGAKHLVENNRPGSRPSSAAAARKGQNKRNVKSLAAWFKQQIVLDKSPIYGQGFKEVNKHVSLLGLQAVLDYIKRHKALPNRS